VASPTPGLAVDIWRRACDCRGKRRWNRRAASLRYPDGRHYLKIGIGRTADPELPSVPDLRGWFRSAGSVDNRGDFQAFVTRLLCIDQAITMGVGNEPHCRGETLNRLPEK
jgi:hypothetical protein